MNRQSYMEISKSNFKYNIEQIRKYINNSVEVMPVIKANGYGTYINKCLELIREFKIVAVACVSEAIELRNVGYKGDIFVLNQPYMDDINNIIKYDVTVGVSDLSFIKELGKCDQDIKVHIEVETGMGRTGVFNIDLPDFIDEIEKHSNIKVEGVYTHFSSADSDYEYTEEQISLFNVSVDFIKDRLGYLKYIHCAASNGLLNFPIGICNTVRAGLIIYGYYPSEMAKEKIDLKPIAKLKSKISFLKNVDENFSISYGRRFISDRKMKIATVGIGYADGIRRSLSNRGFVVVNGCKCKILGSVCMDSFMVDVTEVKDVSLGDTVYLWDNDNIKVEDVAFLYDTINYEVLVGISERVPRIFVD